MKMQVFLEIAATSKSCSTDSINMFCVSCMAGDLPLQEPSCAFFWQRAVTNELPKPADQTWHVPAPHSDLYLVKVSWN